jgi:hypothetical protein
MARNPVQFQKGLSPAASCAARRLRVPEVRRPQHGKIRAAKLFQFSVCRHQASAKAGMVVAASKLPLTRWSLAVYLMTESENDIAAFGPIARLVSRMT